MKKKALFVVDVQPATLSDAAKKLVAPIADFIAGTDYNAYVEATYRADEKSNFFKQSGFSLSAAAAGKTAPEILQALDGKALPCLSVTKNTRSCFAAFNGAELGSFLENNAIEEIHLLGFDINDCVLASAYAAADRGYCAYVIEDLCGNYEDRHDLKNAALSVLRAQDMTTTSNAIRSQA